MLTKKRYTKFMDDNANIEDEGKFKEQLAENIEKVEKIAEEIGNITTIDGDQNVSINYKAVANVIDFINQDRDKAEELLSYFRNRIEMDNDRLGATREAMTKSLEIKNKTIDQLLKFLEIQAKVVIAKAEKDRSRDLTVNVYDGEVKIDKRSLIEKIDHGEI